MRVAILALFLTTGCGEGASLGHAGAEIGNDASVEGATLPAPPEWAKSAIDRNIADVFPGTAQPAETCIGYVDQLVEYFRSDSGARYEGWAFSTSQKKPYQKLLVTDDGGVIRGAGETITDRPDVVAAMPAVVNNQKVGFMGTATVSKGVAKFYGVNEETGSTCFIGQYPNAQ